MSTETAITIGKLLSILDDCDVIMKNMTESALLVKNGKIGGVQLLNWTQLLVAKHEELRNTKKLEDVEEINEAVNDLLEDVKRQVEWIYEIENELKHVDQLLAKRKLKRANRENIAPS